MQILTVIIIIGLLIFVHELGHFLCAKWMNIPVKIFSIGFPLGNIPPLLKFNWKETECQLNIIPLGGFCAFMDDDKEIEKVENDQRFLNNRKIWERFIVISGGVVGNFIFAIFVAVIMFFSLGIPEGREFSDGVMVLDVKPDSPADKAGIKRLDNIIAVDGITLTFDHDLSQTMGNLLKNNESKDTDIAFVNSLGEREEKTITPVNGTLGFPTEEVAGILVTKILPSSPAESIGLKPGDVILSIAGKNFKNNRNPEGLMKDVLNDFKGGKQLEIEILRNGQIKPFKAVPDSNGKLGIGIEFIKGLMVKPKDNTMKLQIPANSIITEVNKNILIDTSSLMKQLIAKHKDGTEAKVTVKRGDKEMVLSVIPDSQGIMGVQIHGSAKEVKRPPSSIIEPFTESGKYIISVTIMLSEALFRMLTGQLTLREVGGPIMVVAMGTEIAQADFTKLFQFTILISIELVILNLLPIPAVDGGHLFLLIIEKIRGRRLPREFEERIHYAGLIVLLGLGIFLIFKDVLTLSKIIR